MDILSVDFTPQLDYSFSDAEKAFWFIFNGDKILINKKDVLVPCVKKTEITEIAPLKHSFIGFLDEYPCFCGISPDINSSEQYEFINIRSIHQFHGEKFFNIAGFARQLAVWEDEHNFCSRCGKEIHNVLAERAKICMGCGLIFYPKVTPAVIMAVTKGDEILLVHASKYPPGLYSVLAGFVEPGETLESAVKREVKEEVGIEVKDISYFSSQPWPFPHSIMIGFNASYAGGDIIADGKEIESAAWYKADSLPANIPSPVSISRRLIDNFLYQVAIKRMHCCFSSPCST